LVDIKKYIEMHGQQNIKKRLNKYVFVTVRKNNNSHNIILVPIIFVWNVRTKVSDF